MNDVNELFRQNMTEFLQSDIDGSVDFLPNAITIQSLEKYLKTFYTPPLDIDQISSIWDQILCKPKNNGHCR
jgi:peptidase E